MKCTLNGNVCGSSEPKQVYARQMSNTNITLCKFCFFGKKICQVPVLLWGLGKIRPWSKKFKRLFKLKCDLDSL